MKSEQVTAHFSLFTNVPEAYFILENLMGIKYTKSGVF